MSGGGTCADANSPSTTFTMPAANATVTATYKSSDPATATAPQRATRAPAALGAAADDGFMRHGRGTAVSKEAGARG